MAGPIEIGVRVDPRDAQRGVSAVDRSFSRMGQVARRAGAAAAAGLAAAAVAGAKLAQGAAEDQLAATRMAVALRNRTNATDQDIAAVERWIVAQGKAYGVADDELRPAIARLATATGDIGEAQRLTSLAMDIAAGRGAKLATVTNALEKAQNGSLTGLTRLGIKTKDASGRTLELDELTRQLAQTYRGQAAKSAETAAGQYERLKVFVNETGEAIGYTLLPTATRLAQFIQSRGVPTLESYWQTYERNGLDGVVSQLDDMVDGGGRVEAVAGEVERSLDALWRITRETGGAFADAAEDLPAFLSPLKAIDSVLGTVASGLEAIPDPVKSIAVQAGVAALVLPRLSAGVTSVTTAVGLNIARLQQFRAELTYTETRAAATATMMERLGGAARAAAGIGGMLAMTQAASTANDELQVLGNIGGGALLGFSVGGPVGAAIGGTVGGLIALSQQTKDTSEKARTAALDWRNFAGALDQSTGAITRQTRETVVNNLAQDGLLQKATTIGITQRQLVNGVLGETNARRDLRAELIQQEQAAERLRLAAEAEASRPGGSRKRYGELSQEYERRMDIIRAIEQSIGAEDRASRSTAERLALINRIPKKLQLEIQNNTPKTIQDFARLNARMRLTPRQLRTVLRLTGSDFTLREIRQVQARLRETGRIRPNFGPYNAGLGQEMAKAKRAAMQAALGINTNLGRSGRTRPSRQFTGELDQAMNQAQRNVRRGKADIDRLLGGPVQAPNMEPFTGGVSRGIGRARGTAASQSPSVGHALTGGVAAAVRNSAGQIAAEAHQAVVRAIASARAAARAKSPSRETFEKVGVPLADGVIYGMRSRSTAAQSEAAKFTKAVIAAAQRGTAGTSTIRDLLTKYVERRVDLKDDKAERKREAQIIKNLRERIRLVEANGRAQDRVNRRLEQARDRYRQLVQASREYAAGVKSTVVAFGSVVGLGAVEEGAPAGTVSLTLMLDQLRDRAARAERFNVLMQQLAGKLNRTTIEQLKEAGPEAALGTLEAIARGGPAAIAEINRLTGQIAASGGELGTELADRYHQAGIDAAAGLVRGLEARSKDLDRAARRLAAALVKAMRRQLGIKGLELGLDETRARRAGAAVASGVKAGYARPQFTSSFVDAPAMPSQEVRIVLTADSVTALQAGKSATVTVDVARAAGVRRLAVGGVR